MDLLQFAVFAFLFVCAMCPVLLHQLHMFQLNSYKPRVHLSRTLKTQPKRHLYAAAAVLCIPSALLIRSWGLWLSAGIMLITGLISLPKKAKKPLVFTKRIVRLVATLAVIIAIIAALPLLFPPTRPLFLCLMAVLPLLSPLLMLLANLINQPIERAINERFIKEAKSVIADFRRLTVIGVTGSYGKTSLKYFLGRLLSQKYNTLITPESYNTTLGVVRTIREKLRPVHEFFVCEMGARNVGDIKEICDIALPKHGVITSVGEQHLESFKTLDNILKTKFELADALPEDGILFVNMDSEPARERARHYKNVVGYGCDAAGDYTASDITVSGEGSQFKIEAPDGSATFFETRLIGRHNVLNITGAVAVAHTIGVPMDALVAGVRRLEPVQHRLQLIRSPRGIMIDDAYNSNPRGPRPRSMCCRLLTGLRFL